MAKQQPKLVLPKLHPWQAEIAMTRARVRVVVCGRRAGKTILGGAMALTAASGGLPCAWLAPTYKQALYLWRFAENAVSQLKRAGLVTMNKSDMLIEFPKSRGFLMMYSMENASVIKGQAFALVIVDEAAQVKDGQLEEIVIPTLADYPDSELLLIGTPIGLNHYFGWYNNAKNDTSGYSRAWRYSTLINPAPSIQAHYHEQKEKLPDRIFQQEYMARFIEDGSGVFSNVRECATATPQNKAEPHHQYILGADIARAVGGDNSVFSVLDISDKIPALVHQAVYNGLTFDAQIDRLKDLYDDFRADRLIIESNSLGMPVVETLQKDSGLRVTPFKTTSATKQTLIDGLALALERSKIAILDDEDLINELLAYVGRQLPSGAWSFSAPSGMHDDRVMSLALAHYGASESHRGKRRRAQVENMWTSQQPVPPGILPKGW